METILTVLSTLGVGALAYAFAGVIRLSRRVNDLELVRMEIIDLEGRLEKELENEIRDREQLVSDVFSRLDETESSTDRRTDKLWAEWHNLNDKVKQLDKTINPNLDKLK
jgi:thiazole synthase ThiGH ThiG subunit